MSLEKIEARDRAAALEKLKAMADQARQTLELKAQEAAKGHDWVVGNQVWNCTDVVALAEALGL